MHVISLDHVNIRTADAEGSARFCSDLLGLTPRGTSMALPPEKARWLFDFFGE